jgi:hypothetical protein
MSGDALILRRIFWSKPYCVNKLYSTLIFAYLHKEDPRQSNYFGLSEVDGH